MRPKRSGPAPSPVRSISRCIRRGETTTFETQVADGAKYTRRTGDLIRGIGGVLRAEQAVIAAGDDWRALRAIAKLVKQSSLPAAEQSALSRDARKRCERAAIVGVRGEAEGHDYVCTEVQ